MKDTKKSGLLMLLGGSPKESEAKNDDETGADVDAGQALLDAISAKDPQEVVDAFKLLMQACDHEEEEADEDEE